MSQYGAGRTSQAPCGAQRIPAPVGRFGPLIAPQPSERYFSAHGDHNIPSCLCVFSSGGDVRRREAAAAGTVADLAG